MSEKPVASIKTLARYEPDTVYIGTGEYVADCVRADDGDYYLAADVDAAIEALRAEVERWKGQHMRDSAELRRLCQHRDEYKARAERLAKPLNAYQMGLRYAVRVWVLSDEIAWSEEEIDEVVESIISDAKKEAGHEQ